MKDPHYQDSMNNAEVNASSSFTLIVRNFKADNYIE